MSKDSPDETSERCIHGVSVYIQAVWKWDQVMCQLVVLRGCNDILDTADLDNVCADIVRGGERFWSSLV